MRLSSAAAAILLLDTAASALALPGLLGLTSVGCPTARLRDQHAPRDAAIPVSDLISELWKRKGGGGAGGRGGSTSGGGGLTSGGASSSSGRGSSTSSTGGSTTTGSGVRPAYGGGAYYGGGTTIPYRAGAKSTGALSPLPFVFAGAAIAFWPGLWLNPVYLYPYVHPWSYYNASSGRNESRPVTCGCEAYQVCGCDDNSNSTYVGSVMGNGSYDGLNKTLVTVADVNGTTTILLNGTLPNGTTAAGGTESPSAAAGLQALAELAGWWPMTAAAVAMVLSAA